jgi:2-isopropylmalate synthase
MNNQKETNNWNPTRYQQHAHFVSDLAMPVVDLLDPRPQEHILDLGCGEGTLGLEIMHRGTKVLGVDLSPQMVAQACINGLEARVMSVIDMPFVEAFDAVFSNAMLHWVKDAELAVANVACALKKGGRFIAEFGGEGNVRYIVEAMREEFVEHPEYGRWQEPWYFPTPREYSAILEAHGLSAESIELIPRPTPIDDIANWLEVFTGGVTAHLSPEQTHTFRTRVRERLKATIYTEEEGWIADYVRLRVKAIKI